MKRIKWYVAGVVFLSLVVNNGLVYAGPNLGNIPGLHTPVGQNIPALGNRTNAPQMKLTLRDIKVNNRSVLASGSVDLEAHAVAWIEIHNLGTVAGQVRAAYMIGNHPYFASNIVSVAPNGKADVLLNIRLNISPWDRNIHTIRRVEGLWWNPRFALLTTGSSLYRDSYMQDNSYYDSQAILIKVKNDLAVVAIENIKLTETWQGGQVEQSYGTVHPVSLEAVVKIKNNGTQTSQPTVMSVIWNGIQPAHSDVEKSKHAVRHRAIDCAGRECLLGQAVNISAIRAGDTGSFRVRFEHIPYYIMRPSQHHGLKVALGPYICERTGITPGHALIKVQLQRAAANEVPRLRTDNQLILNGKFGHGDVCGFVTTSSRRR